LGLGYSQNGVISTNIFAGPVYNNYELNIYVQIYDNDTAFTVFEIPQVVRVIPDYTDLETNIYQLITQNPQLISNVILNEGSYLFSIQEIQRISSLLNEQSLSDKKGLILNGSAPIFPQIFGPLSNYSGVIPVKHYYLLL